MSVQKADLEAKLREIQGAIDETTQGARNAGVLAAVGVVVVLFVVYLIGRRKGKKGGARIEVYRT
ncbi:MAG TPA: hypothetical protein VK960_10625 [Acidimicrobiia bacterium]|nr:hypothetical protein [Acidimicrobiia bacterium]